jgi:hypothetical protein
MNRPHLLDIAWNALSQAHDRYFLLACCVFALACALGWCIRATIRLARLPAYDEWERHW